MKYLLKHLLLIKEVLVLLLVLLFAVFNAYVINWYNSKDQKWSVLWHRVAMMIRILVVLLMFPSIKLMLIFAWLSIVSYDIIIALIMNQKWYYIGATATIDKLGTKVNYGFKILLTIGVITYLILI